ncbi:N-acetylmuramoyl-L-alanine amidase [Pseudoblastomonas flavescens]|nr:N-acetylmuramoyl-L-alanine amidase [Alteriqipengyuania flavescens]WJY17652.1 N-acetylmuramoyl-L-alanine amidase [Alteriqipengyuania flavescens]
MTRISYLAVHCSATPAGRDIGAADIRQWHRAKGWKDIGYHYVIRLDGTIEKGRPDDMPGAHEPKINRSSIAVCLVGGSPPVGSAEYKRGLGENTYTPAQFASLKKLLLELSAKHPGAEVLGHRDVQGVRKACPSFDVKEWWAAARKDGPDKDCSCPCA